MASYEIWHRNEVNTESVVMALPRDHLHYTLQYEYFEKNNIVRLVANVFSYHSVGCKSYPSGSTSSAHTVLNFEWSSSLIICL